MHTFMIGIEDVLIRIAQSELVGNRGFASAVGRSAIACRIR